MNGECCFWVLHGQIRGKPQLSLERVRKIAIGSVEPTMLPSSSPGNIGSFSTQDAARPVISAVSSTPASSTATLIHTLPPPAQSDG